MSYTGDVSVGGPAETRELPGLTITKVAVGPMNNNAYLLHLAQGSPVITVLVGGDDRGEVQQATGAATVAHPDDAGGIPVRTTALVRHGDSVTVGDARLSVIHLRGHTPGSIALCYDADGALAGQLITDLEDRIFGEFPDGTWVYPGHGADTTIGTERPQVPQWRARGW